MILQAHRSLDLGSDGDSDKEGLTEGKLENVGVIDREGPTEGEAVCVGLIETVGL